MVPFLYCAHPPRRDRAGGPEDRAEPARTVSQRIADTTITLEYNRLVARGAAFGALVPYGKIWCPCADDATTIELTTTVKIDGRAGAGKSGLYHSERGQVDGHLQSPIGHVAHAFILKAGTRCAWKCPRGLARHMETLAFYFPKVDGKKAELEFQ
jgi:hypothetical protein